MNKAIILLNLSGSLVGGAQRRYANLFDYLVKKRSDYYLIINDRLFDNLIKTKLLSSDNNVCVIYIKYGTKPLDRRNNDSPKTKKVNKINQNKLIQILGSYKTFFKLLFNWILFIIQFTKIINQYNIKLIYSVFTGGIWAWPLTKLFCLKHIHSYNDSSLSSVKNNFLKILDSEYWVLRYCDKIDFLSKGIIANLENLIGEIEERKIYISPNSFINYQNYFPEFPKENYVIFMSRFVYQKNPLLFLEAVKIFNRVLNNPENVRFLILGGGRLENEMIEYIYQNKLWNVHMEGPQYKPWTYLRKSKVFISIQEKENYPSQSLLEAMACENAIIASDIGETRRLVTKNEGILVKLNAEEIASAIEKLFSEPFLIEKLGKNARKKALKNHNIKKFAKYFISITK